VLAASIRLPARCGSARHGITSTARALQGNLNRHGTILV
jgi:hypothetical protein